MTDAFTPVQLTLATSVETLATASHEATAEILTGEGLRRIIAERLAQVTKHGHTPEADLRYEGPDLAAAAMAYLGAFIELETNPDYQATSHPDCWPFETLFWKEPRYADRVRALVKAGALIWAELDRVVAAEHFHAALRSAARPLAEPRHPDSLFLIEATRQFERKCGGCGTVDEFGRAEAFATGLLDTRTLPPCSKCHPEGGLHE